MEAGLLYLVPLRPGTPEAGGPWLVPGQVLQARVVAAGEGRVDLVLLGRRVAARTSLPLSAGQTIRVRVEGVVPGEVRLRLLSTSGPPSPEGADRLAALLRSLGVEPGPPAEAAVRGLLLAGLPVTASRLRPVLAAIRRHPGEPAATASAAALLLARGIPPRGEALAALRAYLEGLPPFGDTVARLERLARAVAGIPGRAGRADGGREGLVRSLLQVLEALTLPGEAPAEGEGGGLAARLEQALRLLGLDHERATYGPGPRGEPSSPQAPPGTLKGLLLALRGDAAGEAAAGGADPAGGHQGGGDGAGSADPGPWPSFRGAVEDALRHLNAWQLLSSEPEGPGPAERRLLVFGLPVGFGGTPGTVEVAVERPAPGETGDGVEAGPGRVDDAITVRLRLSPPRLGEVRVRMALREGRLGIGVAARTPEAVAALEAGREELSRRLEGHGFVVAGVAVRRLRPSEETAPDAGPAWPSGVDLIV